MTTTSSLPILTLLKLADRNSDIIGTRNQYDDFFLSVTCSLKYIKPYQAANIFTHYGNVAFPAHHFAEHLSSFLRYLVFEKPDTMNHSGRFMQYMAVEKVAQRVDDAYFQRTPAFWKDYADSCIANLNTAFKDKGDFSDHATTNALLTLLVSTFYFDDDLSFNDEEAAFLFLRNVITDINNTEVTLDNEFLLCFNYMTCIIILNEMLSKMLFAELGEDWLSVIHATEKTEALEKCTNWVEWFSSLTLPK